MKRLGGTSVAVVWMLATTVYAAPGGDFESIDIEIQAKSLSAHNAANMHVDPVARSEADRLVSRAAQIQESAESGALYVSPLRLRSLERAIDNLREHIAASVARASSTTSTTGLIQGHVYPAPNTAGAMVKARDFSGKTVVASAAVASDGSYSINVPAPGTYTVETEGGTSNDYLAQLLGGQNCEGTYSARGYYVGDVLEVASNGTVSEMTPNGAVSGLDFTLKAGGSISGTVLSGGNPVVGVNVYADMGSGWGMFCGTPGTTDASGHFVITGLPTEQFVVYVDGSSVVPAVQDTVYPNVPCGEADCSFGPQTYVGATEGVDTPLVNPITVGPTPSSVSGTVVDATTSTPVVGAAISLISEDGWTYDSGNVVTDASGAYTVPQVRPTDYRIVASASGYIGGVYVSSSSTAACVNPAVCDPIGIGGKVTVGNGVALTNYNLKLSKGASVSGTVTRASDHSAVAGAVVTFANSSGKYNSFYSDASGSYTATGLPDGSYTAYAQIPTPSVSLNLAPTGLGGTACEGDYDPSTCSGTPVTVSAATPLTGINVAMAAGGTVTGLITDGLSGAPNPYAGGGFSRVELVDSNGNQAMAAIQTSASGYAIYGMEPGSYTPIFTTSTSAGWIDIASDGTPCPRRSCSNLTSLPKITVSAATPMTLNVTMPRGALLVGKVKDASTSWPILQPGFDPSFNGDIVPIVNWPYGGGFGIPDGTGVYFTRQGFAPGTYYSSTVWEIAGTPPIFLPFGAGYINQAYNDVVCPDMTCNLANTTAIPVGSAVVMGIDYTLSKGGSIYGTVTDTASVPINNVTMSTFDSNGQLVAQAQTNALGAYTLRALPTGNYFVATTNALGSVGYLDQVYSGMQCTPTCNPVKGTQVGVTIPSTTSGINFSLLRDQIFSNGFE